MRVQELQFMMEEMQNYTTTQSQVWQIDQELQFNLVKHIFTIMILVQLEVGMDFG